MQQIDMILENQFKSVKSFFMFTCATGGFEGEMVCWQVGSFTHSSLHLFKYVGQQTNNWQKSGVHQCT